MKKDLQRRRQLRRNINIVMACVVLLGVTEEVWGQSKNSSIKAFSATEDTSGKQQILTLLKKVEISGTIRMRYTSSFEKDVGIDGLQHSTDIPSFTRNAFTIPQARVVLTSDITKKMNVYMRVNFGDFAYLPQSRVLEYAYATYSLNKYFNLRAGLFRPWFGREDDISTDFLKSFDYSNQYTAFSEAGWTSYQMGLSLFGTIALGEIPLRYYTGVFNGNGRNNFSDNDNGKQFSARMESDFTSNLRVGINGGLGTTQGNNIYAWGADVNYQMDVSDRWSVELESEFKQGNNQMLFFAQAIPGRKIGDYQMRGVYVLPSIKYKIKAKEGLGLEASFKYEDLNPDFKQSGNAWRQYVPMIGMDFADVFAIRLQVGMVFDRYDRSVVNTTAYNSGRFITQLQLRF